MEHSDGSPNFDSLFTAAESKTGNNSNTYNVECSVTVRQNIDTKNVLNFLNVVSLFTLSYFEGGA